MIKRFWTRLEPFGGTARKRASYLSRAVRRAGNRALRLVGMCPVRFSGFAGFWLRNLLGQTQLRRTASETETQLVLRLLRWLGSNWEVQVSDVSGRMYQFSGPPYVARWRAKAEAQAMVLPDGWRLDVRNVKTGEIALRRYGARQAEPPVPPRDREYSA